MDYSISYHPISEAQMRTWYYDVFEDIGTVNDLTLRIPKEQLKNHTLEELEAYYKDKFTTIIKRSRDLDYGNFNKWHAYFIAIAQGFFEKFYFVQGSALSSILDKAFHETYITDWADVTPSEYIEDLQYTNKIDGAFSGGVYLSAQNVKKLLHDYENDPEIKDLLKDQFEGQKIDVLLAALKYASQNDQGLLEAVKVITQSDQIFEEPSCFSNVFNCDVMSAAVYTTELAAHYDAIYKGTGE